MSVQSIKFADKYFGTFICFILGLFTRKKNVSDKSNKVCFIQLWGVGETITTLPAIRYFNEKYPKKEITIICTERVRCVYEGKDYISRIESLPLDVFGILVFVFKDYNKFGLAVDFEEYLNISSISAWFIAKERIGYKSGVRSRLYNWNIAYNDRQHISKTHMDLLSAFGIKKEVKVLDKVHIPEVSKKSVKDILKANEIENHLLIGLAPGAAESSKSRMWPVERFAHIAEWLIERYDAKIILIGNDMEKDLCDELCEIVDESKRKYVVNLAGKTSIQEAFALIEKLDLLISNDSGPMHIGSSLGIKTIGLFGPNLPVRFGAIGERSINIYRGYICKYSPCINVHKGQVPECLWGKDHKNHVMCMKNITLFDVRKAVTKLL